jgi:anti-sigma regulatory factor (Ser/Thr protein kinase)
MTVENGAVYGAHTCPSGAHSSRQLRMTLPAVSHSVRLSRHATRAALTAWQLAHVDETAALLVSELVTNAIRHAEGIDVVTVNLQAGRTWLRIEVQDADRHWPEPRIPGRYDESGFGFILVDALASNWGVRETEAGKAVWAELDTRQESGPGI